ncbi:sugar ABC transporter substrate-binding protein [Virgibacillus soli]|uniref:ABC transporter substrate-binding protein n=1 Tax=Lederbergia galactosidilytica TaxID=217031 RepID=UPI000714FC21|nr:ABC transporter substrate-binding protein [Lederbergia galactosidilytica]KRG08900.1 sugar ABC transporter substrate-binding protein [Virgibacillus soli]MBP1916144.1 putative aldouronate transport system substrate-binding protein [Lederbergia galactosidilytica]
MFRRKWPLWSLMLVFIAGLTLAGCSSDSDKKKADGSGGSKDDPITLTFFNADLTTDVSFDDPVAKKITEKTGIVLDIEHPVGGDEQAIPLMIASGEYPDMIYAKGDIGKLIEAGGVIKLDDLIEEKGENLKKMYGDQIDRLRNSIDDPSIYTVGTYGVENAYWSTSGTMSLQLDVLRELGYPDIKTLDDYEKALKDYIAKHPEVDGQKTIGLSLLGSDWRWLITVGNPAGFSLGIPDDGQWAINDDTGEATYKFMVPEIKEYFKWLNHMNDIGLLDPESFTQTHDTYISKLSSGRVLGIADQDWNFQDADKALKADGKDWRTYAPLPVTLDESYKSQGLKDYGFAGGWGISISSTSEYQEEAFEFLDWMASEEAQILLNWGIEGVNYDVVDGKRVLKDEDKEQRKTDAKYPEKTGVGQYVYPFPQWGNGAVDSTGNPISPDTQEDIIATYTDAEKEVISEYGMKSWVDWFPSTEELGISKHGSASNYTIPNNSDLQTIQQKADDFVEQKITQAILGKPADFDKAWDDIQAELIKMDIEKANAEMTKITQDTMELWGTK